MLILTTKNSGLSSYFWIIRNEYVSSKTIGSRLIKTKRIDDKSRISDKLRPTDRCFN